MQDSVDVTAGHDYSPECLLAEGFTLHAAHKAQKLVSAGSWRLGHTSEHWCWLRTVLRAGSWRAAWSRQLLPCTQLSSSSLQVRVHSHSKRSMQCASPVGKVTTSAASDEGFSAPLPSQSAHLKHSTHTIACPPADWFEAVDEDGSRTLEHSELLKALKVTTPQQPF